MPEKPYRVVLGLGVLGWLVVAASLFYVSHKPFTPEQALTVAGAAFQVAVAALVVVLAGGIGVRILPRLDITAPVRLALQAAMGLGMLGLVILLLGSIRINLVLCWLFLLVFELIFWRYSLAWLRQWRDIKVIWQTPDGMVTIIAFGTALILFLTLCTAVAPPLKFDALVYHLALPARYLQEGQVMYTPDIMFWGMPQTGEMLYTLAMGLSSGASAATTLGWSIGLLTLVGVVGYTLETFNVRAAWVAAACLLEGFTLAASLAWGYVDWLTALFGIAFFISLDSWLNRKGNFFLLIAGLFAGFALGTKYTGGILLAIGIVVVTWHHLFNRENRDRTHLFIGNDLLASLSRFLIPGIIITIPWWIRNAIYTHNPFYPFFFPSGAMDQFRINFYQTPVWGNWLDAVLLPWRAVFLGSEGAPGYSATIGFLMLGLGLCAPLAWKTASTHQRLLLTTAAITAMTGWVIWAIAGRLAGYLIQTRLYQSIFPALAILAGVGFAGLDNLRVTGVRIGRVAGVLVVLSFLFSIVQLASYTLQQGALRYVFSQRNEKDYLSDNLGWYAPAVQVIKDLPDPDRVLMLWEPRSLYCTPRCQPDDILDRWKRELNLKGNAGEIIERWRAAGYTHLLYYRLGAEFVRMEDGRYRESDWQVLDSLLQRLPTGESFGDAYVLYPLTP